MNADAPVLSIIIPVFNEAESLPALFERLEKLCTPLAEITHEVVFVDDHSVDASPRMLAEACRRAPHYRFIRLSRNSGSHIAIFAGLEHARGQCVVFLAADLQDPPELIPKMLEQWRAGHEVVWAVRAERQGIPFSEKLFASAFYGIFNRVAHVSLPPQGSDFALLDRVIVDGLRASVNASPFLMGEIAHLGYRQTQVDYVKEERRFGKTKWNIRKKLRLFADAFVACSYFPLRAMSYVGLTCSVLGFLYALFIVFWSLVGGGPVAGWASLMVVVLVLGGIQMTMLGVLGEYLWRTLEEARRRPAYFVERRAGFAAASEPSGELVRRSMPAEVALDSSRARPAAAPPPAAHTHV